MNERRREADRRILISGGGVAGYTLAWWLHRFGFEPVVVERASANQQVGYGIEFVGTAWDVADRMGLVPQLERHRIVVRETIIKSGSGESRARLDLSALYGNSAKKAIALDRSDLVRVLYDALPAGVDVRFSTSIEKIEQSPKGVYVEFEGGRKEHFELLIGADGYRSQVRSLVFGPHERFDRFLGYFSGAFYAPNNGQFAHHSVMYLQPGLMATVLARDDDRLLVNVTYEEAQRQRVPGEDKKAAIAAHALPGGWFAEELLAKILPSKPMFLDAMAQIEVAEWSVDRVALVGDAAYCMSALSGQGTSMAMAGAWKLAEELARHPSHTEAFLAYEGALRGHIRETQRKARSVASSFVPSSSGRVTLLIWMMKLMAIPWVAKRASSQFNSDSLFDKGLLIDREFPAAGRLPPHDNTKRIR